MSARCTSEAAQQGVRDDAARSAITRPAAWRASAGRRGVPRRSKLYSCTGLNPLHVRLSAAPLPAPPPPQLARGGALAATVVGVLR